MFKSICLVLISINLVWANNSDFPDPLTSDNFEEKLSKGLHLVEFFSPYCSHCKHLAPTWEKTWEDFHIEGTSLGIGMAQVDCVESGDLCNTQRITGYPALKLYGPDGFIKNYPRKYGRNQEDITKFMKEEAINQASGVDSLLKARSKLITTDEIIKILAEPIIKPFLISFWPSSELKEDISDIEPTKFKTPFDEETCEFQRVWKKVTNVFDTNLIDLGHFNCLENKKICQSLEINKDKPGLALILPEIINGKVIVFEDYIFDLTEEFIFKETNRFLEISRFESIDPLEIISNTKISSKLSIPDTLPVTADTYFVYLYDEETASKEDFEIFPYLIQPLSKLPGTHLIKSNNSKFLELAKIQKREAYKLSPQNYQNYPDIEYNEQRGEIELLTTLPTLISFKEYGIAPEVFHSFSPADIRDQYKVKDWLKEQSIPYFQEITKKNAKKLLAEKSSSQSVIQIVELVQEDDEDQTDLKATLARHQTFRNLLRGYQGFLEARDDNIFQKILKDRQQKMNKVLKLKQEQASSQNIVKALFETVDYKPKKHVDVGYIDINNRGLLDTYGLNIDDKELSVGDVIIIDRETKKYYDTNSKGEKLNTVDTETELLETLSIINGLKKGLIRANLRGSPYSTRFRLFDNIHQFGFIGYFFFLVTMSVILLRAKKLLHKKKSDRNLGILDKSD